MGKIKAFLSDEKSNGKFLVILFIIGIILFVTSEYISNTEKNEINDSFDETAYTAILEEKLSNIISKMNGVSEVSVMITLENSESLDFVSEKTSTVSSDTKESFSSVIFREEKNGGKSPVLSTVKSPDIKGVCVVCTGGENAEIKSKIISLISSTLNLTKNRIYVTD